MRKVNYKEKGITLIALVITIIILLILAGVTLTTALGQNGLFQRAKYAGEKYKESEADEAEKLGEVEKEIDKIVDGKTPSAPPKKPDPVEVTEENIKEFQGKYVDIGLDVDGDEDTTNDWEIFYARNGRIFLIAADYVPVSKLTEWGVIGENGSLKDNEFQQYSNSYKYSVNWSTPKTFLNLPSTPENFLSLVMHTGYDLASHNNNINSIAVSHLLNKDKWKGIKEAASADKQQYIDFVIGGPTLEMWCAAWEKAIEGNENGFVALEADQQTSGTGYNVKYNGTSKDWLYVTGNQDTTPNVSKLAEYKTFFPQTTSIDNCNGYWLVSPSAAYSDCLVGVYFGGNVSILNFSNSGYCVRPVVTLISDVQIVETSEESGIYNIN